MGHTLVEKLMIKNTGDDSIRPGDIVIVNPDCYMIIDAYSPSVIKKLEEMGFDKVLCPEKAVVVFDHLLPVGNPSNDPLFISKSVELREKYKIQTTEKGTGISHTLMHEKRYAKPGTIVTATDSHTTTYGGGGCLSTGIGYSDMAAVLGTDELWLKVPNAIKIVLEGKLKPHVTAKDIVLKVVGDLKADGGQYKSLEFTGPGAQQLSMQARYTICNMALEAGAKCALFEADDKTAEYFDMDLDEIRWIQVDEDAEYESVMTYDLGQLEPQIAKPKGVDDVYDISKAIGTKIDEVFIGSCTNGSIEDMAVAAEILKGNTISPYLKLVIIPASNKVFKESIELGYIETFLKAGATVSHPSCGLCAGFPFGLLSDGEVVLSTSNRNFIGRMGTKDSLIYLSSPAVAAASALAGEIVSPDMLELLTH
ncbi:aconitase/3-isopropylmalate dehydratase large subunit family protein [Mesobacillus maritimus]|uniref:3-isopropylmalate dehydratase large subunit n=1 Tax=Mesobacillus maritimus TaxID=1643336 RepID=UPI0020400304|nr:aconitase/3-isopropylmalate dehydratase large subunit family protein [Mesobacillus maritimus]MCM3671028.1 aconitase/3-isopropylmalate dehydratase large subunit family protein [Mesobacillus maritimus]